MAVGGGAAAHVRQHGDRAVIRLHGEIDMASDHVLAAALDEAGRADAAHVVVDLGAVRFMDSAGLEVLLAHRRALLAGGRTLGLTNPRRSVRRLLELTRTDHLLGDPV